MPRLKKAELIEGVVHVPSPARQRLHSGPQFNLIGWMLLYRARTPGVEGGDSGRRDPAQHGLSRPLVGPGRADE
jgi:hypothetical protein